MTEDVIEIDEDGKVTALGPRSALGLQEMNAQALVTRLQGENASLRKDRPQDTYRWGEAMPQYAALGIGAEAWVELKREERRAIDGRYRDTHGIALSWGTLRLVLSVLRAARLEDFRPLTGLRAEAAEAALSALRSAVKQIVDKWRAEADRLTRYGDMRDDPYDDRACELKARGKLFYEHAKELSTLAVIVTQEEEENEKR